jgi:hypothetical protein
MIAEQAVRPERILRHARIARSILQTPDMSVDGYLRRVSDEAVKVDELARLLDAECKIWSRSAS